MYLPRLLSFEQQREHAHERHGGGNFAALRSGQRFGESLQRRRLDGDLRHRARRQAAAQRFPPLADVAHLGTVVGRPIERSGVDRLFGDRDVEAAAEVQHLVFVQLLLLMRDVAAFAGFAQAVALDGLGQDHGGRSGVLDGALVGVVNLQRIVAAAPQTRRSLRRTGAPPASAARDTCRKTPCGCKRRLWL